MPASDWQIEQRERVESTQLLARGRPAWSAVVAREQQAGRGQAERSFVSDPGGLYVTAGLPYSGDPLANRGFALAVGWSIRSALRGLGAADLRLRWPNDLMAGRRKLGGILVEQGGPDTLLVGVGLNVHNRPWAADPALVGNAGRLADVVVARSLPDYERLAGLLLEAIRAAHEEFSRVRLAGLVSRINECWGDAVAVELKPPARHWGRDPRDARAVWRTGRRGRPVADGARWNGGRHSGAPRGAVARSVRVGLTSAAE